MLADYSQLRNYAFSNHAISNRAFNNHAIRNRTFNNHVISNHAFNNHAIGNYAFNNHSFRLRITMNMILFWLWIRQLFLSDTSLETCNLQGNSIFKLRQVIQWSLDQLNTVRSVDLQICINEQTEKKHIFKQLFFTFCLTGRRLYISHFQRSGRHTVLHLDFGLLQ